LKGRVVWQSVQLIQGEAIFCVDTAELIIPVAFRSRHSCLPEAASRVTVMGQFSQPAGHQLGDTMTKRRSDRFERFKIIFPILLAGWIPSILTLIVSYTILRDTLEFRILRDRQTLIQLVGHLVAHDLNRSSSVIEYYQTLPELVTNLSTPNSQLVQQWLNSAFYSHPQIDGMFITAANGDLIASIPTAPEMIGKDFGSEYWREQTAAPKRGRAFCQRFQTKSRNARAEGKRRIDQRDQPKQKRTFRATR
jgi:hypothetical protein